MLVLIVAAVVVGLKLEVVVDLTVLDHKAVSVVAGVEGALLKGAKPGFGRAVVFDIGIGIHRVETRKQVQKFDLAFLVKRQPKSQRLQRLWERHSLKIKAKAVLKMLSIWWH
jgi:hypothetical protein